MPSFPRGLLALSDDQLATVMAAAAPLAANDRSRFLEAVADRLTGVAEPGDGLVARVCRETQRTHFDPPDLRRWGA
jgi:hypothetical protein